MSRLRGYLLPYDVFRPACRQTLLASDSIPISIEVACIPRIALSDGSCPCGPRGGTIRIICVASDALWSGCLLVALCGEPFAARVSGSIVSACGLPELVTHTLDDYERLALHIATDANYRAGLRAKLEANKFSAPLFDSRSFVIALESIYHEVIHKCPS